MYIYLDSADMPDDLYKHLFLSFIKRPSTSTAIADDLLVVGGRPNGDVFGPGTSADAAAHESPSRLHGLAEKLHGLTEKLHNLGGSVELSGRRSRAGMSCLIMQQARTRPHFGGRGGQQITWRVSYT